MLTVFFIRHGATPGNLEQKYIGRTDEPLSETGIRGLEQNKASGLYPAADRIFSSPMQRCIQTARLLYPGQGLETVEGLRECDFGEFENRNYRQLSDSPAYQAWIDSGGNLAFPGGEHPRAFRERCTAAFLEVMDRLEEEYGNQDAAAAFIVHGGTVMSVMEALCTEKRGYYDWRVPNGEGYGCSYIGGELRLCFSITS